MRTEGRRGSDGGASLTNTKEYCTFEAGVVPKRGEVTHRVTHRSLDVSKCRAGIGGPLPWGRAIFLCTQVFSGCRVRCASANHSVPTCEDLRGPSGQAVHLCSWEGCQATRSRGQQLLSHLLLFLKFVKFTLLDNAVAPLTRGWIRAFRVLHFR